MTTPTPQRNESHPTARYRVRETEPGVFEFLDTKTASRKWRVVETHTRREDADAAAAWWNARASGGGK